MKRGFEVRLLHAVQLGLILSIALVAVSLGWIVYSDLYRVILDGFDRKLRAISTATGSFIEGDEHRLLAERGYRIRGLAFDPESGRLYGIEASKGLVVEIDPETGLATPRLETAPGELAYLAIDPEARRLVSLETAPGGVRLAGLALPPEPAAAAEAAWEPLGGDGLDGCIGLARAGGAYYCGDGESLLRIDAVTGSARAVAALEGDLLLAAGPRDALAVFETLWPAGGAPSYRTRAVSVTGEPVGAAADLDGRVTEWGFYGFAWDAERGVAWLASDHLHRVEGTRIEHFETAVGFDQEVAAVYRGYVEPMRRIRERAGITYLYTQIPHDDPERCIYILDANRDQDHSLLGDEDDLPEENVAGQRDVVAEARVFLSPVRDWEQWGLLKVAFAPIFDRQGEVAAIAGADVNITIIREKTREALLRQLATGALCLLIGGFVAIFASRKITEPVAEIKDAALKIGAGEYDLRVEQSRLLEIDSLGDAFNGLGQTLGARMDEMERSHDELEVRRRLQEMREHQAGTVAERTPPPGPRLAIDPGDGDGSTSVSGAVEGGGGALVWLAPGAADAPLAARLRHDVGRGLTAAAAAGGSLEPLFERLASTYPEAVDAYLWIPDDGGPIRWLAHREAAVRRLRRDGTAETLVLAGTGSLEIAAGEALVAGGADGAVTDGGTADGATTDGATDARRLLGSLAGAEGAAFRLAAVGPYGTAGGEGG